MSGHSGFKEVHQEWPQADHRPPHWQRVPFSFLGRAYWHIGNPDLAIANLQRAVNLGAELPEEHYVLGLAHCQLQQYERGMDCFNAAIAANSADPRFYVSREDAFQVLENWHGAIENYSQALELDPECRDVFWVRGLAFESLGDWDSAIQDFSKVVPIEEYAGMALLHRGVCNMKLQRPNPAIEDFTSAIELGGSTPGMNKARGLAFLVTGQWRKAIDDFTIYLEADPDPEDIGSVFRNRGIAYGGLGEDELARKDLGKAVELDDPLAPKYLSALSGMK